MKIVQINAVYKKSSTGRTCEELERELVKKGHLVVTAYGIGSTNTENSFRIGNKLDTKLHGLLSRVTGLQGYFSIIPTIKLIKYMKDYKPDIVHLRNLHSNYINIPMLLKYLGKNDIATVITLHDCFLYTGKCTYYFQEKCEKWQTGCGNCPRKGKDNKSWFFDFSLKMWNDKKKNFENIKRLAVVGVSDWTAEHAKKSILKSAKEIKRIYNWIDLDLFKPHEASELKEKLNLDDNFIILCIAQKWSNAKGVNVIKSLGEIMPENWRIVMIGELSEEIKLNEKVICMGTVSDTSILSDYYSMADVFVTPSVQETFGKTMAEALSCGTPVIAFRSLAAPEIIGEDDKCGYLVNENNPQLYLEKLKKIEENGKKEFAVNCRERSERYFDIEKNVEEYVKLYERLLKS